MATRNWIANLFHSPARTERPVRRRRLQIDQLEDRVVPATAFTLLPDNSLISFDTANPGSPNAAVAVTGLGANEDLVGIDFRPQNGLLYGLTASDVTGGSAVRLYAISVQTGVATPLTTTTLQFSDAVGTAVPITGTNFGFDFNPAVDRIRVVTDTGMNFRINPNTGALVDGNAGTLGTQPDGTQSGGIAASAAAYTNNSPNSVPGFIPTTFTTLYTLDATNSF